MARRRRKKKQEKVPHNRDEQQFESDERPSRRRFGLGRTIFVLTILFLIVIIFLPTIIASTPLAKTVVGWAASDFKGDVGFESISLAWWSPVQVRGLVATDEQGNQLVSIENLKTEKSLLSLASSSSLGKIKIESPHLNLQMRGNTTNIEAALEQYINAPSTGKPLTKVQVEWTGATADITAVGYQRKWSLSESSGVAEVGGDESPLQLTASGLLGSDQTPAKPIQVAAAFSGNQHEISFAAGLAKLSGEGVEVSLASPVFERLTVPMSLAGYVQGGFLIQWSNWGESLAISSEGARLEQLTVVSPDYLSTDSLRLQTADFSGTFEMLPSGYAAKDLIVQTDVGSASANGQLDLETWVNSVASGQLPQQEIRAEGNLDLARLALMLPATLHIQEGVQINRANLTFQLTNWLDGGIQRANFNIESPRIEASRNGQPFSWNQPIRLAGTARQLQQGLELENFRCDSKFLEVEGSGTLEQAAFTIKGDLNQLNHQLSQMFDFGELKLAGKLDGQLGWDRSTARSLYDPFKAGATLVVESPLVQLGETRWEQPKLELEMVSDMQINQSNQLALAGSYIKMDAGQDSLTINLREPIQNVSLNSSLPIDLELNGGLHTWLAQLSPFIPLENIQGTGQISTRAVANVSRNMVTVDDLGMELTEVDMDAYGFRIREPRIVVKGNLQLDPQQAHFLINQMTLASSTVSASGQSIRYQPGSSNGGLEGQVAFRADINRVAQCIPSLDTSDIKWFGDAVGNANLKYDGNQIDGTIQAKVTNLVAATAVQQQAAGVQPASNQNGWNILWEEQQVDVNASLAMTPDVENLKLDQLTIDSQTLQLAAAGQIQNMTTQMNVDVHGNWTPDLDKVNELVSAYTGEQVKIAGGKQQAFTIKGAVFDDPTAQGNAWLSRQLKFDTNLAWQQLDLFGFDIGPSLMTTRLANSAVVVNTQPISVSGGTIQLQPTVHLRGSAPTIVLPEGKIADQVQLTPENCRGWLKYVAPIVADATASQGTFSLTSGGARIPLANVNASKGDAEIVIHQARVGPGPLGQQLIGIANQVKTIVKGVGASNVANQSASWIVLPEQRIPVQIERGQVVHRNVAFDVGGTKIITSGSVGLDQRINMVAEIPIADEWLGDNRYLAGLRGQKISIPIAGTLSKPQLDSRVLQSFAKQMLQQTAQGAIENEINGLIQKEGQKFLDGILGPQSNQNPNQNDNKPASGADLLNQGINRGLNELFGPKKQ